MILVASAGLVVGVFQAATSEYISCHYKRDFELRYLTEKDEEETLTVVTGDMILVAFVGLVVGVFQAATIEYISCHYKRDFELRYLTEKDGEESTLRPIKKVTLSMLAFSIGGIIPVLAVSFVTNNQWRRIGVSSVALTLSRIGGTFMGRVSIMRTFMGRVPIMCTTLRMMIICWFFIGVSYVLTTLFT
ncbi:hypothetical protein NE237_027222 [Protea cynaroides]|uniref:Vacuolar iron transporter n=1 Tax=Protea cynaroides TaxID=273540 RepID=A0A9Q0JU10_9MAGN|nr:hypothetical protein NE237_027222 [Protea cynaroides]